MRAGDLPDGGYDPLKRSRFRLGCVRQNRFFEARTHLASDHSEC